MTKENPNGIPQEDEAFIDPLAADEAPSPDVEALVAERDEYRDRFMRALADAENARKRADKERRDAEQYGGSRLARDLLPVHDALTRALESAGQGERAAAALIDGVELTLRELNNVFGKHGIKVITPAAGDKFDPLLHEAMFEAAVPGTIAGNIIQVMDNGFMLHDRLLRPAKVGVSSTPAS
ncbi:molecular chaperone GrpE [Paracoccus halophilus]|uniref:Protein GrpE n=1 Tax=Paracoccus halophilus TaxID=376733 RepID=A0A099F5J0_9RHOB|nr:nucleotide exchange factor GrpE [Paracoccus halophilus]KGJ05729.1 molecular chaperone GrpE [Paracoccus halophilus]SFA48127.1 molecular chaperone GrpE [Paracoccus halophilus]